MKHKYKWIFAMYDLIVFVYNWSYPGVQRSFALHLLVQKLGEFTVEIWHTTKRDWTEMHLQYLKQKNKKQQMNDQYINCMIQAFNGLDLV